MMDFSRIEETGIIPVVVIDDSKNAVPLAKALIDGGIPAAEVTYRTSAAKESILAIKKAYPEMLVGAGTVLNLKMAQDAIQAGAEFIVSPGFDKELVEFCQKENIAVLPGIATATDLIGAYKSGLNHVKFFPAEQSGGMAMIKALSGPFTKMKFLPTGGLTENNMHSYLTSDKVFGIGGSWMVKSNLIKAGKFDEITALCISAVLKFKEIRPS